MDFLSVKDYLQTPKTNKQLFTANTDWRVLRRNLKLLCKANPITFMSLSVGFKFVYVGNVHFMIEFKYVIPPLERSSDFGFEIQNLAHMTAIQRMLFISVTRRTS